MFMVIKKNKIVLYAVIICCVVGIYTAYEMSDVKKDEQGVIYEVETEKELMPGEAVAVSSVNDELMLAKSNREIVRSKSAELLRRLIDNENTSVESKKSAEDSILKLASAIDKEQKIESLLLSKGYKDTVAFVSDDSITLTIRCEKLESKDTAKITDIIYEITGNNIIKIVEVN